MTGRMRPGKERVAASLQHVSRHSLSELRKITPSHPGPLVLTPAESLPLPCFQQWTQRKQWFVAASSADKKRLTSVLLTAWPFSHTCSDEIGCRMGRGPGVSTVDASTSSHRTILALSPAALEGFNLVNHQARNAWIVAFKLIIKLQT